MNSLILSLLFIIQSIWFGIPADQMPPSYDIRDAREFALAIDPLYVENGITDTKQGWIINEYDVEAWSWQHGPPYSALAKAESIIGEGFIERLIAVVDQHISPPPGWRAGTSRMDGEIVFNPQWNSPNYYWYQHPGWVYVVPHEMAHVYQTPKGYSSVEFVEWSAQIITMEVLASSDHPYARVALIGLLREELISSALYASDHPRELLDKLKLQDNEYSFYLSLIEQCEISEQMCDYRANSYYRGPLVRVLADQDGVIRGAATVSGEIQIDDLKRALQEIFGMDFKPKYQYD